MSEKALTTDDDLHRLPTDQDLNRLQRTTVFNTTCTRPTRTTVWCGTRPTLTSRAASPLSAWPWRRSRSSSSAVWSSASSPRRSPAAASAVSSIFRARSGPDAAGHKGFCYHFLDIDTGRRVWDCELSTLDSAFLFAGVLTCATYFDADSEDEAEVRRLADELYRLADWNWACDGGPTLTHGWKPETGFIPHRYTGYDEGLLLYLLGLGSPTHPLPAESYAAYCATYQWKETYGRELLYSGPLFTHQLSHLWVDFRGIRDAFMRERGSDYFENSRQATYVQQEYAIRNPLQFVGYGEHCWGFTACDGPGLGQAGGERHGAAVLRLRRPRRPVRPGRRYDRSVGRGCLAAVRPGNRHPHRAPLRAAEPGDDRPLRVQAVVQPDVHGGRQPDRLVGDPVPLRHRPGAGRADDRELPLRPDLGHHAPLPGLARGTATGRVRRRLAVISPGPPADRHSIISILGAD